MRELADARRWIARMSTLVGREDMVGELMPEGSMPEGSMPEGSNRSRGARGLPRVMKRDLFEAGLNEAAGSLAATYGRWSFVRCVERGARGGRRRRRRHS